MRRLGVLRGWIGLFVVSLMVWAGSSWAAEDTIVLGTAMSLTGKYAREGKFYMDAYTMTVDAVNRAGGVKVGGKAYKLELKSYDDQRDHDPGQLGLREVRDPHGPGRRGLGPDLQPGVQVHLRHAPQGGVLLPGGRGGGRQDEPPREDGRAAVF